MIEHYSENIQSQIKNELSSATRSIKIAVAWFTNAKLFLKLISKMLTGVSVELVLNKDEINCSEDSDIDFQDFVNAGGIIHWCDPSVKLMHEKFCLIDDNIVIFGSYNWTNKAEYNHESISIARNEKSTIDFYSNLFDELCKSIPSEENVESKRFKQDFFYISAECLGEINGVEIMKKKDEDNGKGIFRLYNSKTKQKLTSFDYSNVLFHAKSSDSTVIAVKKESKWFFFNTLELFLHSDISYQDIQLINNYDSFWVKRNGQWGIEKNDGTLILDCKYDSIEIKSSKYIITKQGNLYGVFDWCDSIWNCIFESIDIIKDGLFKVKMDGYYGVFDNNQCLINCDYDEVTPIEDNYFIVKENNMCGVCSHAGSIIPCLYDEISYHYKDRFIIKKNGKYGYYIYDQLTIKCIYDELCVNRVSIKDGKKGVIADDGTIVIDFRYSQIAFCDFSDPPYNDVFFLVYEKPYYGIWVNGREVGKVHELKYSLQDYIPEFTLFNENDDCLLEELRHAIVRTIYEDIVWTSKKCNVSTRRVQFSSDNSFQNLRPKTFRFDYTIMAKIRKRPFWVRRPLSEIICKKIRSKQFKEGDIMYISKSFPVIQDIYGYIEQRYIIAKVYSPSSEKYYYTSFNPLELKQRKRFAVEEETGEIKQICPPKGTAMEIWNKATSTDEIFNLLTHHRTKDCQICISKVIEFFQPVPEGCVLPASAYSYDLLQ